MNETIRLAWYNWIHRPRKAWRLRRMWVAERMPGRRRLRDHWPTKMIRSDLEWGRDEARRVVSAESGHNAQMAQNYPPTSVGT